uniref:Phosphodiesterase n=3 Tax=Meloidogyne incognita group TaxID=654580 RepID=A0A914L2M1_MELIC
MSSNNNKSSSLSSTRNRTQSMGSNNSSTNSDYYLFNNGNTKSILKNPNLNSELIKGKNGRRFRQYSMEENSNSNNNSNSVLGEGRSVVTFFLNSEESPPTITDNTEKKQQKHKNRQRASLSSIHPNNLITSSTNLSPPPFRRTSLPVQSNRQNLNLSQVHSARGLLMDLLASNNERRDLSPQVTACLRAVTVLLNSDGNLINQKGGGNLIDGSASATALTDLGIPHVADNPYNGETNIGMTSKPRVSNITFSTVTSATGLPTIAAEPSRPRSSSYWKALPPNLEENQQQSLHQSPQLSPTNTNPFIISPTSTSSFCRHKQLISSSDVPKLKEIKENNNQKQSSSSSSSSFSSSEINQTKVAEKPFLFKSTSADNNNRGGIEMTGQPKDVSPSTSGTTHKLSKSSSPTTTTKKQPKKASKTSNESLEKLSKDSECQKQPISSRKLKEEQEDGQKIFKTSDGTIYELNELESKCSVLGQQLQEWSFPIFNFADKYKNTVLSRLTFAIFKEADLFKTFKISYSKFFNFFHALESGYWDIPYHNQIHAADVLHGCFYLTCHSVHAFYDYHQSEEVDDEGEEIEELSKYSNNWEEISKRHQQHQQLFNNNNSVESTAIPLSQSMSALELMALYSAAAMHDYDHPGRTNAFLVASEDKKAILYNDRSVLENHHAAESWKLLTSQSSYNFIENLDSAETKRFRYLVLEYILATDLKQHFDIIVQFNERAPSMDLSNESDRMLISLMIIKFADINSPAKPFSLHKQWTERICQEFYEQGDEERLRNMAISPYMDRSEPAVAKLQDSFIAHIVNPLAIALNEANLLPILPGLPESELIINLRHNHQKWLNQIEFDQKFCREGEDGEGNALERNKPNISR